MRVVKDCFILKSDNTKDIIKHAKLITTKKNCRKVKDNIFVLSVEEF